MNYIVPLPNDIEKIFRDPQSKLYNDLRDRVSYLYLTGSVPTHLRAEFNRLLCLIMNTDVPPALRLGRVLAVPIGQVYVDRMRLLEHPMVVKVTQYQQAGYRIDLRGPDARRSFGRVHLVKGPLAATVKIDGSVLGVLL